jgi:hypothetical protein
MCCGGFRIIVVEDSESSLFECVFMQSKLPSCALLRCELCDWTMIRQNEQQIVKMSLQNQLFVSALGEMAKEQVRCFYTKQIV